MKKFFIMAMAIAAMSLTSCGNKSQSAAPADETEVSTSLEAAKGVVDQLKEKIEAGDSQAIGEAVQTAVNKLAEMVAKGDTEAAKQYQEQIKNFVEENAEKIKEATGGDEAVSKLIDSFVNVPVKAEEAVEDAKEAAEEKVEDAKEAVEQKIEDAKEAAADKVEEAKEAAAKKVEDAKDAAAKKVEEAKDAAAQKIEEAKKKAAEELLKKMQ